VSDSTHPLVGETIAKAQAAGLSIDDIAALVKGLLVIAPGVVDMVEKIVASFKGGGSDQPIEPSIEKDTQPLFDELSKPVA